MPLMNSSVAAVSNLFQQQQPFELPDTKTTQTRIELFLKVETTPTTPFSNQENGLDFTRNEIKLTNKNATIFQYIQNLIALESKSSNMTNTIHFDKMKNIWNVDYTLIYHEV